MLLVAGVGCKTGNQQPGVAIGPERSVDLVQVALTGFDGQPINYLAYKRGVNLGRALVVVLVHKNDVQITSVPQLFAAQFAVGNDCKLRRLAVSVFKPLPAPFAGHSQNGFGQRSQVIGDFFNA